MTWTTERPTKAGWYWVRWPKQPKYGPEIFEITMPNGPDTEEWLEVNGLEVSVYIKNYGPIEWQGPLEPEEG